MRRHLKLAPMIAALALAVPALALATPANEHSQGNGPQYTPTPPPQANAYGVICKNESKEHKQGEKGTAFSRCVTALAHAANHPNQAPGQVCKGKSKKHVKGEKGTEFSRCVKDVVKLRHEEHQASQQS